MDDLLKEAIADAKAVRETALANAKMALEEAFTPRLKSMLASKIANEVEGEEPEIEDAEETEEWEEDDEVPVEPEAEVAPEEDEEVPVEPEAEMAPEEDEEVPVEPEADFAPEEDEEEDVIEINGVKYAPVVSEEEDEEEAPVEEDEAPADEDELDLEAILRELEEEDEDDDTVDENDVSSDIGKADNKVADKANDSSDVGQGPESEGSSKEAGKENAEDEVVKEGEEAEDGEEVDEDIDLEEVLKALSEEEDDEDEVEENAKLKNEIKEHRDVVKYLRAKLNEVNLLNAKLLFSNKLFRTFGLTNEQKMKVVETFDRTKNLREIKLVYSTLAESFGQVKASPIKESVRKGSSSKAVASTKPKKKVISEGDDLKARFKKLANII